MFFLCLCTVAGLLPLPILFICILAIGCLADPKIFCQVDYSLILTFIGFFIFIGNLKHIPAVSSLLSSMITGHEVIVSVLASQVISNVPTAILLSGFTEKGVSLLIGTNLGGLGTKEIKSLEERLRTRFEWGLTADVQPPDFETRVAIVKRKAELLHLDLPEDVAEFIANHLKNNIRQLEGAVKKLNAYYMLEGIQPVISVAQNAIKDILNETQPVPVTIEKIIGEVSRTFNVSPADIRGTKRNANVASARRVAIYILREVTGMSMEEIGREFSGRDHSTIVYSLKTMERDMKNDQHLRETVSDIIKNVKA